MGLGPLHIVSLEAARERARQCRVQLFDGIDPLNAARHAQAACRAEEAKVMLFSEAMQHWLAKAAPNFGNATYAANVKAQLERYAMPLLGSLPVTAIDSDVIVKALSKDWERIPVTMDRVRNRIASVLDWAVCPSSEFLGQRAGSFKGGSGSSGC